MNRLLAIFFLLLISGCRGPENRFEEIDFLLDWQAEPTYLGIYWAKENGLFEAIGIELNIVTSWGANEAVSSIAAGRYKIGTASGGATVLGADRSRNIVSLGVLYDRISTVIYGLASNPVSTPKGLVGKRIGIYPKSITKNEFDAFLNEINLNINSIDVVSLSGADIPYLRAGEVDAVLQYAEMTPAIVETNPSFHEVEGERVWEISLSEYGVEGYGLNVIISKEITRDSSELFKYKSIFNAVRMGYQSGCENRDLAVDMFVKKFPNKRREYVAHSWNIVCDELLGYPIGEQSDEGWEQTIKVYQNLGLVDKNLDSSEILIGDD